jgi:hypothetical protein
VLNPATVRQLWEEVLLKAENPPKQPDLIYLCGQTKDNRSSVIEAALGFHPEVRIACPGHENSPGFEGFLVWKQSLIDAGIDEDRIVPIESGILQADGSCKANTLTEAQGLVKFARANSIGAVAIVAPRWHIVRCFMTFVGQLEGDPTLRIHPALGKPLLWDEAAAHSQGSVAGIRADLPAMEMARIFEYHEKGDLPYSAVALAHLQR